MRHFWKIEGTPLSVILLFLIIYSAGIPSAGRAQQLTSANPQAISLFNEGLKLADQENFSEALAKLRQAIDLDPAFIQAHLRYMDTFRSVGRESEVAGMYKNMLNQHPTSALYHFLYGRALEALPDKRAEFKKALEIDSTYYWAQFGVGGTYMLENRYDEAIIALNKSLEMKPDGIDALTLLSTIYIDKGMPYQARSLLEQALAIDSLNPGLYMKLGQAFSQLEKYQTAEKAFRRAAALKPDEAVIYYYIGLACELGQENDSALENYEKFIQMAPSHELAPAAKKIIERLKKK